MRTYLAVGVGVVLMAAGVRVTGGPGPDVTALRGAAPPVQASRAGSPAPDNLELRLGVAGDVDRHDPARPLLIDVTISDPRAVNARTHNANVEAARKALEDSGQWDKMSDDERRQWEAVHPAAPLAEYALGTAETPLWSLVRFDLANRQGVPLALTVRPLAFTRKGAARATVDGSGGALWLIYGLDPAVLATAGPGRLQLRAVLDTTGQTGMWQGRVASEPIAVELAPTPTGAGTDELAVLDTLAGQFHLLDDQFEQARLVAEMFRARQPESVPALALLGDALKGLGRLEDAAVAYERGIAAFEVRRAAGPSPLVDTDAPIYLSEQLQDVRRMLAERKR